MITNRIAPSGHLPAYLGEVVVHAQDIRHPLGLERTPGTRALTPVAQFYAARNFTVNGRDVSTGLHLQATDGPFTAGTGPTVTGTTLALVMVLAGRGAYLEELQGPGVRTIEARLDQGH